MLTDCIEISTQSKDQPIQQSNTPFFIYNFPNRAQMEYQNNQLPQLQLRNSNDSIFKDNGHLPSFLQGMSMPSFQFNNSNNFFGNEPALQNNTFVPPTCANFFNEQLESKITPETKQNRIIFGTQTLCDIEIVLISRYFDIKNQLFCPPNVKYNLNDDKTLKNNNWLKDRMKYRYKKPIKDSMFDMIDVLSDLSEKELKQLSHLVVFQQNGFDNVEKQVPKSVKQERPFEEFMLEVQNIIVQFLLTKF